MKTVALAGTFDTKREELLYVKGLLEALGLNVFAVHTGVFDAGVSVDVANTQLAAAVGEDMAAIAQKRDRAKATAVLSEGLAKVLPQLYAERRFDGVLSFGGSGGTALVTPAMRALPIGTPKVMVSTMASGNVSQYVGTSDIIMIPSIVDVAGLNEISRTIFRNAVLVIAGLLRLKDELPAEEGSKKPLVAATMFGVTTPCVDFAREALERRGYEVLVFHATGTGGKTMESLIASGYFKGVLDLTTTEWCDELVGGALAAGPHRSEAAVLGGVPQVVSVGAVDMVNFGAPETVPKQFEGRNFYRHNPTVTLMRTTAEENAAIAAKLAEKLNMAKVGGRSVLLLPKKGVSMLDAEGQAFYGPEEDAALFGTLREKIDPAKTEIVEMDCHINDREFAETAAERLVQMMEAK
ncbi:Tm-1-like ATP-binding domain-containing protein [Selenomonas sp. TAMA-11512]|uniref:Tm-1-like ATP-binding domain-containing protein n=1 Tax=Selenomonas sp. TAMA-11512 TaxID=3095337 RepID=UPI0030917937|nr:Tm-1-like ATP-binding domain-containing protein [Selenomonas sp. TAMA-11512]